MKVYFWKYCRRLSALISHVLKKLLSEKYNNFTTEKNKMLLSNIWVLQNYLPKPLCVLVEGTAPCRNSCLELSRMSWSPAMMETPSLHSLVIGSEGVEVTVMEKETSCALCTARCVATSHLSSLFFSNRWHGPALLCSPSTLIGRGRWPGKALRPGPGLGFGRRRPPRTLAHCRGRGPSI